MYFISSNECVLVEIIVLMMNPINMATPPRAGTNCLWIFRSSIFSKRCFFLHIRMIAGIQITTRENESAIDSKKNECIILFLLGPTSQEFFQGYFKVNRKNSFES